MTSTTSATDSRDKGFVISKTEYNTVRATARANVNLSEFLQDRKMKKALWRTCKVGGSTISTCGLAGSLVGLAGGPPGIGIGAGVGAGVGMIITFTYGAVEISETYNIWRTIQEQNAILAQFDKDFWNHPDVDEDLICSITDAMFRDPVITPCGHTFEKIAIKKWLVEKQDSCPMCRAKLSVEDLVTDYVMIGKIKKTFTLLVEKEKNNPNYPPQLHQAFVDYQKLTEERCLHTLKNISGRLCGQLKRDEISPQLFADRMRVLCELYPEAKNQKSKYKRNRREKALV